MSYNSMAIMQQDAALRGRLVACAAEQNKTVEGGDGPEAWVGVNIWDIVASPGWGTKWDYAIANNNPNPGSDPAVISDEDILSVIQPMQ